MTPPVHGDLQCEKPQLCDHSTKPKFPTPAQNPASSGCLTARQSVVLWWRCARCINRPHLASHGRVPFDRWLHCHQRCVLFQRFDRRRVDRRRKPTLTRGWSGGPRPGAELSVRSWRNFIADATRVTTPWRAPASSQWLAICRLPAAAECRCWL